MDNAEKRAGSLSQSRFLKDDRTQLTCHPYIFDIAIKLQVNFKRFSKTKLQNPLILPNW